MPGVHNGMNSEPPIARFQVEHPPRRPGYARRSSDEEFVLATQAF
jgi:hypothetical protein